MTLNPSKVPSNPLPKWVPKWVPNPLPTPFQPPVRVYPHTPVGSEPPLGRGPTRFLATFSGLIWCQCPRFLVGG